MICFLTSRTDLPDREELNPDNRFIDELRRVFPNPCRALNICSDPDGWEKTDFYVSLTRLYFENAGFRFDSFRVLDGRNAAQAKELVRESNLVILGGGHVPTQNRFFHEIGLRELMKEYEGIVVGISAGSMNSAALVYAQPEEEGEAVDPSYRRFLTGLGLTKTMLLPHYQEVKDDVLDGMRLFADITCPDSMGKCFYAIPDGTYLFIENGREELRGEAWQIRDGVLTQIAADGEIIPLN
ncbi:MAG: Type 1 glutamine amidotransferase-like domain-containing protein [Oscillospiraceae bacterium]|nr:Type 1 glutamine amidotransferase-like domain-containing protein [Oscillospiraceae bacterium]